MSLVTRPNALFHSSVFHDKDFHDAREARKFLFVCVRTDQRSSGVSSNVIIIH